MSRYIDADALKDHTTHYVRTQPHFHYGDWDNMCISGKEIDEIVDTCPTADVVEVRHGSWIVTDADDGMCEDYAGFIEFKCSECGLSDGIESGQYDWYYGDPIPWKFCPICGARMDGERSKNGT